MESEKNAKQTKLKLAEEECRAGGVVARDPFDLRFSGGRSQRDEPGILSNSFS